MIYCHCLFRERILLRFLCAILFGFICAINPVMARIGMVFDGYVYDDSGPIVGADVCVKNTNNCETTDEKGYFVFYDAYIDMTIEISSFGCETLEVKVNPLNKAELGQKYVLKQVNNLIDDVVVIRCKDKGMEVNPVTGICEPVVGAECDPKDDNGLLFKWALTGVWAAGDTGEEVCEIVSCQQWTTTSNKVPVILNEEENKCEADCLSVVKQSDDKAVAADLIEDDQCRITKCSGGYKPDADGTRCVSPEEIECNKHSNVASWVDNECKCLDSVLK